jgi:hypothetical protein
LFLLLIINKADPQNSGAALSTTSTQPAGIHFRGMNLLSPDMTDKINTGTVKTIILKKKLGMNKTKITKNMDTMIMASENIELPPPSSVEHGSEADSQVFAPADVLLHVLPDILSAPF